MARASQENFVAARPSLFTLVRKHASVNRASDDPYLCSLQTLLVQEKDASVKFTETFSVEIGDPDQ
jgi:hypothetical protein